MGFSNTYGILIKLWNLKAQSKYEVYEVLMVDGITDGEFDVCR